MANTSSTTGGPKTNMGDVKRDVQNAATGVADKARDVASGVMDRTKDAATGVADKAREMAGTVVDRTKDAASNAADTAREWASTAGKKAEDAFGSVGSGMTSLAGTVRENLPHEGMMGQASEYVADALESGGRYIQQEGFSGMADDVTNLIRKNPIPALLVGIGIGYLIARSTSRS
jgi:ElaB/YqjD/DUF883 family membrane-anchored ribosome-binding protein